MPPLIHSWKSSPVGPLLLIRDGTALVGIHFARNGEPAPAPPGSERSDDPFREISRQLDDYFASRLKKFDLELELRGTEFQRTVWSALLEIPYGATTSYSALAAAIGRPAAIRAVGAANGSNPIPIVVPCHRVIGRGGSLTGFGGGLEAKRFLLDLEMYGGRLV